MLLQSQVRGWLARQAYRRVRAAVVYMQCCVRRRAARRELLQLKKEARSVERYRELNKGMEVKLMQLQRKLDQEVDTGVEFHICEFYVDVAVHVVVLSGPGEHVIERNTELRATYNQSRVRWSSSDFTKTTESETRVRAQSGFDKGS